MRCRTSFRCAIAALVVAVLPTIRRKREEVFQEEED